MPRVRWLAAALPLLVPLTLAASPASAAVVVNEVETQDPLGGPDFIELANTDAAPVDLTGYVIKDSNNNNAYSIPGGTTIPAGGHLSYASTTLTFNLSDGDAARLFAPGDLVTPISSYSWTSHAAATWGRCPDGTGAFTWTVAPTPGAANSCAGPATSWPGGADAPYATDPFVLVGPNLSGLAYQPSGSAAPGVLWAVRNNQPAALFRLVNSGGKWKTDTANGWTNGKTLRFPDGSGVPDAEGVTLVPGESGAVYVSIERNDTPLTESTSRAGVLRFDVTGAGTTLNATREWNLTADLPGLEANSGLEAVTWVPDSALVAKGLKDESTGAAYAAATHPGDGVFLVGVEQGGLVVGYALKDDGSYTRVTSFTSGFPAVMDLEWEADTGRLWVVCDDSCDGRAATFAIGGAGTFAATATYARPAAMPNLNNEGFTLASSLECVNGLKPAFWIDDTNTFGQPLRAGTVSCTLPPLADGDGGLGGGNGTNPPGGGTTNPPGGAAPIPGPPSLAAPFKPLLTALPAKVKPTAKGRVKLTLSCGPVGTGATPASCDGSVALTAKLSKGKKAKAKTLASASFKLPGGKPLAVELKLSKAAISALKKGSLKATATAAVGAEKTTRALTLSKLSKSKK